MTVYSETEDAKIVKLYKEGLGVVKISRLLHHDAGCISRVLRENDVWVRGSRNFTDGEEKQIAKIYQAGFSAKAIARAYGLRHHISVCAALERRGVEQRSPPERNRLYALDPHVFDVIDNEEKAYWLGFLYADGSVYRRTLAVSVKATDREHLVKLKQCLQSESPVNITTAKCNGKNYMQAIVSFTDRHLVKRLRELGFVKGRPDHAAVVTVIPDPFLHHFLRGFWDGDGSVGRKPNTGISFCGRRKFMEWVCAKLSVETGTNPNLKISKHPKANLYYLRYSGRRQALKVLDYLFDEATVWLKRKRKVVESWPSPQVRTRDEKGRYV